jgi:thioredoxin-dependent peroxiredoxin
MHSKRSPLAQTRRESDASCMLKLGAKAPAFQLPDHNGKSVSLASLAGQWVVLYFYPRDDTPGCTVEACEFTAAMPQFRDLDAAVYGCSADTTASHQKFIQKHKLAVGLLTDADKAVMKSYSAYGKKLMYGKEVEGVIRSTVVIAPDGTVAAHWPKVKAEGHAEQVRAKLAELRGGAGAAEAKPAKKQPKKQPKKAATTKPKVAKPTSAKPKAAAAKPKARAKTRSKA